MSLKPYLVLYTRNEAPSGALFVNAAPIHDVSDGRFREMDEMSLENLLPQSAYRNINLISAVPPGPEQDEIRCLFPDKFGLMILRFDKPELQENVDPATLEVRKTRFRLPPEIWRQEGRLQTLQDADIYYQIGGVIRDSELKDSNILRIERDHRTARPFDLPCGCGVYIRTAKNMYAGPFEIVGVSPDEYLVQTNIAANGGILEALKRMSLNVERLRYGHFKDHLYDLYQTDEELKSCEVQLVMLKPNQSPVKRDLRNPGKPQRRPQTQQPAAQTESPAEKNNEEVEEIVAPPEPELTPEEEARLAARQAYEDEIVRCEEQIADYKAQIEELSRTVREQEELAREVDSHKREVDLARADVEDAFSRMVEDSHRRMLDVSYNGFVANQLMESASQWQHQNAQDERSSRWEHINTLNLPPMTAAEVIDYVVRSVQSVRAYDAETILDAAICLTQGFITVFSGPPGCGKTSFSDIMARVLGLTHLDRCPGAEQLEQPELLNRYVDVSVERGWSSKRDLFGYYNPLTKSFEPSDVRLYEGLLQLHDEHLQYRKQNPEPDSDMRLPFLVLLDEANLSQMEYYWSEFMNVADKLGHAAVNLTPELRCRIPETLRFFATINNDDTTTPLSPRLIDRSWIVTLPDEDIVMPAKREAAPEPRIVRWIDLKQTFDPADLREMTSDIEGIYGNLRQQFQDNRLRLSHRSDLAIRRYWSAASRVFPNSPDRDRTALDYAVSQRMIPTILGHNDQFEQWLESLSKYAADHGLRRTATLVDGIRVRGDNRAHYYSFF